MRLAVITLAVMSLLAPSAAPALAPTDTPGIATSLATRGTPFQLVELPPPPVVCTPGSLIRGIDVGERRMVAFSFDDGPWPFNTERVMSSFEARGLRATFMLLGVNIQAYPDIARAVRGRGHEIGNHAMSHSYVSTTIAREMPVAQELIRNVTGAVPRLFRSPGLAEGASITAALIQLGLCNVFTTVVLGDHLMPRLSSSELCSRFAATLHPGMIVLLHDGGSHTQTVNAVPCMLDNALSRGYEIVTVGQMTLYGTPYSGPRP